MRKIPKQNSAVASTYILDLSVEIARLFIERNGKCSMISKLASDLSLSMKHVDNLF